MAGGNRLGVDLVVLAIGLNILVLQLTVYLMRSYFGGVGTFQPGGLERIPAVTVPFLADLPFTGPLLNRLNWLVSLSLVAEILRSEEHKSELQSLMRTSFAGL